MNLKNYISLLILLISFVIFSNYSTAEEIPTAVKAESGMVVSAEKYATLAGLEVLKEGGNAVDAAVTVGFTLAVTFPRAGNIGGGGFMLVHLNEKNKTVAIDYREKAPKAATKDMFLDKDGNVDNNKSRNSILSVGVPGTVAGLILALENYGTISIERAIKPAIELAGNGFPVTEELRNSLIQFENRLLKSKESKKVFFSNNGQPPAVGKTLKQKDLAWVLKQISKKGNDGFYKGKVAKKVAKFMKKDGGIITREDLASYKPVIRKPVTGTYRGYEIYSMPPPSSGGVHLIQILNILENYNMAEYKQNSPQSIHIMAEAMKLAYADRSKYLGDPDFAEIPVDQLTSKSYASNLRKKISKNKALVSSEVKPGNPYESHDTTHYSVMDKFGNVVSNTYTLNFPYGTGISVPGTGILLNNEMDDFSAKPGTPNAYGLIGNEYNAIEPEKRMLSSMTPTIVLKDGKPFLVTGSPGGSRIITTVLQILTNTIDYNMDIAKATTAPRIHNQWLPDKLYVEKGISPEKREKLNGMGHNVEETRSLGSAHSITKIGNYYFGFSDPRRAGSVAAGF